MASPPKAKRLKTTDTTRGDVNDSPFTLLRFEKQLVESGSHSDITIETINRQYKLHRLFLMRSSYFNAIFTGNWSPLVIDLKPVEEEVIVPANIHSSQMIWDNFFHYLYTDTIIENLSLKEIEVLVRLIQFFGLNIDPFIEQMKDDFDRMYILYLLELLPIHTEATSRVRDIVLSFCKLKISLLKEKMPFVTDDFIRKVIAIPLIPLDRKADISYEWIKYN
jgi:hypothetical protein